MIKKCVLLFLCSLFFFVIGCEWNHDGNYSHVVYSNLRVNIPLPEGGAANIRSGMRTEVAPENIKVWYYLSNSGVQVLADDANISGLDTNTASVLFEGVPNSSDVVIKSQLSNDGQNFKDYYQGLVSKNEISGESVNKNLNAETTAKTMIFEKKSENTSASNRMTVSELEAAINNGEKNVWQYLGIDQTTFQNSLDSLALDGTEIKNAVSEAANEISVKPTPAPTPDEPTPNPTPTITENGLTEEFTSLNFTPLASLAAINNLGAGTLADVSESGEFICSRVGLRLAAEGSFDGKVREWHVYEGDSRLMLINGISTTGDRNLEQLGYHAMFYNSANVAHSLYYTAMTTTQNFNSANVKVTNGVATVALSATDGLEYGMTNYNNWTREYHEWSVSAAATQDGSVYVRVEDPTTGMARIFDCATTSLE